MVRPLWSVAFVLGFAFFIAGQTVNTTINGILLQEPVEWLATCSKVNCSCATQKTNYGVPQIPPGRYALGNLEVSTQTMRGWGEIKAITALPVAFTMEFYFYLFEEPQEGSVFSLISHHVNKTVALDSALWINIVDGELGVSWNATRVAAPGKIYSRRWYHISAQVLNRTEIPDTLQPVGGSRARPNYDISIWLNGENVVNQTIQAFWKRPRAPLSFGRLEDNLQTYYFPGLIDEFKLWSGCRHQNTAGFTASHVLESAQIRFNTTLARLLAYYSFEDHIDSERLVRDLSGNGFDMTLRGSASVFGTKSAFIADRECSRTQPFDPKPAKIIGVVQDFQNELPVKNAEVRCERDIRPAENYTQFYREYTNAIGEYRFENLPSGTYRCRVLRACYQLQDWRVVELSSGVETTQDYGIELEDKRLQGFVLTPLGKPIGTESEVICWTYNYLNRTDVRYWANQSHPARTNVTTGYWEINRTITVFGETICNVTNQGFAETLSTGYTDCSRPFPPFNFFVTESCVAFSVRNAEDGSRIRSASITLVSVNRNLTQYVEIIYTDATGFASMCSVPNGPLQAYVEYPRFNGNITLLDIIPGSRYDIEVRLVPLPIPAEIVGRVTDALTGELIVGAGVNCTFAANNSATFIGYTNLTGWYHLTQLPAPGSAVCTFSMDASEDEEGNPRQGYYSTIYAINTVQRETVYQNITLTRLPEPFIGQVRDVVTGAGIPFSSVVWRAKTVAYNITANGDNAGRFSTMLVFPENYAVAVAATGYKTLFIDPFRLAGIQQTLIFSLEGETGSIHGRIVDQNGALVQKQVVYSISDLALNNFVIFTATTSTGEFLVDNIRVYPGELRYRVTLISYFIRPGPSNVIDTGVVVPSPATDVNFTVFAADTTDVAGRVISTFNIDGVPRSIPVVGAVVELHDNGGIYGVTDNSGYFTISNVPVGGNILFQVSHPNILSQFVTLPSAYAGIENQFPANIQVTSLFLKIWGRLYHAESIGSGVLDSDMNCTLYEDQNPPFNPAGATVTLPTRVPTGILFLPSFTQWNVPVGNYLIFCDSGLGGQHDPKDQTPHAIRQDCTGSPWRLNPQSTDGCTEYVLSANTNTPHYEMPTPEGAQIEVIVTTNRRREE